MFKRILSFAVIMGAFVAVTSVTPARATTYDKLAFMTFTGQVQIPGATLAAGTYRFRLTNPSTDRNVIQVLSHDGSTVFAMFHTIPASRLTVTDEATVTFRETPAGVPPMIRSLFYGGEQGGYEFVYGRIPPARAEMEAQPAITFAPIEAAPAVQRETAVVANEPAEEPAVALVAEPLKEPVATELPRTASLTPLVALTGLMSIALGIGIGLFREHLS